MQLEQALHKLHSDIEAEEVLFWGKIQGKSTVKIIFFRHQA